MLKWVDDRDIVKEREKGSGVCRLGRRKRKAGCHRAQASKQFQSIAFYTVLNGRCARTSPTTTSKRQQRRLLRLIFSIPALVAFLATWHHVQTIITQHEHTDASDEQCHTC